MILEKKMTYLLYTVSYTTHLDIKHFAQILLTIYLSRVLCLSVCDCVCVCVTIAERSAILLVLVIKLTKETRRLV